MSADLDREVDERDWCWDDDGEGDNDDDKVDDTEDGAVLGEMTVDSKVKFLVLSSGLANSACWVFDLVSSVDKDAVACALVEMSDESSSLSLSVPISSMTILLRGFYHTKNIYQAKFTNQGLCVHVLDRGRVALNSIVGLIWND